MFEWNERTCGLFDLYIEVGEVKKLDFEVEGCEIFELWISSCFSSGQARSECQNPSRRAIYNVVKQIEHSITKDAVLTVQCDDLRGDTLDWGVAVALLLIHLSGIVKHVILFTKLDEKKLALAAESHKFRNPQYLGLFTALPKKVGVTVLEQANAYVKKDASVALINDAQTGAIFEKLIECINKKSE